MEVKERVKACNEMLTTLVEGTSTDQLGDQTPCSEWKVINLLGHVTFGSHMFAAFLRGDEFEMGDPVAMVGDDHTASFRAAIGSFNEALDGADDLDRIIPSPIGEQPISVVLEVLGFDVLLHCWDLATATGQVFDPPIEVLEPGDTFARGFVNDGLREMGLFASEVEAAEDASAMDRLAAFCGRSR